MMGFSGSSLPVKARSFDDRAMALLTYVEAKADDNGEFVDQINVTIGEMARKWEVSRTHATRLIRRMVDEDMLVEDASIVNGRTRYVYWLSLGVCEATIEKQKLSFVGEWSADNEY